MKRLIIHLAIGMGTFLVGVFIELMFTANRCTTYVPKSEVTKPVPLNVSESSLQPSITSPAPNPVFDYDPKELILAVITTYLDASRKHSVSLIALNWR